MKAILLALAVMAVVIIAVPSARAQGQPDGKTDKISIHDFDYSLLDPSEAEIDENEPHPNGDLMVTDESKQKNRFAGSGRYGYGLRSYGKPIYERRPSRRRAYVDDVWGRGYGERVFPGVWG